MPREWLPLDHSQLTYAITVGWHVKIGTTLNITERLDTLQVGNPFRLHVIGLTDHPERAVHRALQKGSARRAIGEWWSFDETAKEILRPFDLLWVTLP